MGSINYKILGYRRWVDYFVFLFREIGVNYEITFVDPKKSKLDDLSSAHPQGKIPTLCVLIKF